MEPQQQYDCVQKRVLGLKSNDKLDTEMKQTMKISCYYRRLCYLKRSGAAMWRDDDHSKFITIVLVVVNYVTL